MAMIRLVAWITGLVLASLVVMFGLVMTTQIVFPAWYAVPGAILDMTDQQVAASGAPVPTIAPEDRTQPTPGTDATVGGSVPQMPLPVPTVSQPTVSQPTVARSSALSSSAVVAATLAPVAEAPAGPLLPSRRFNILLLGSDNDLKFPSDAVLTQAMILVSVDPTTHDVAMISIPRDFWVPISGYGHQKIDAAYEVGGIALTRLTVETLFGVKIDYYAWVGLSGLVRVIDTLGGVDLTVEHPILDEAYPDDLNSDDPYAFFRLYIPAGPQHLDAIRALEYVRSRHGDLQSDFGRSARQQQVLVALKDHIQTLSIVGQVPELVGSLQGSVKTDLSVPALLQLALLGRNLPPGHLHQQVLAAPEFASLGYSPDGTEQVVFPDWAAIRPAVSRLLGSADSANAAAGAPAR